MGEERQIRVQGPFLSLAPRLRGEGKPSQHVGTARERGSSPGATLPDCRPLSRAIPISSGWLALSPLKAAGRGGKTSHGSRRGFTLIEVLVAGIVLSLSAGVIAVSLAHGYRSLADARDERRAAVLLDELMTKIDLIGPARIAAEGPRSGKFDGADERFSWSAEIGNRPQGHLYQVTVTLSWAVGGRTRSARVQTYLNDPKDARDSTLNWDDL